MKKVNGLEKEENNVRKITLGSLFDGIGGFPLAARSSGVIPVWASEINSFCTAVTRKRFPGMIHLGSVTEIKGGDIRPVDIITFGSPCQNLSVAGNRQGLAGEQSGLFFEAVRIIREMRETTNGMYPAYAVWENVPGSLSSGKGRDFRTVLQSLCEIKNPGVSIPEPPGGKWRGAGTIVGNGYSLAWRIMDAQFWGVPQRRRRIFLVMDCRGYGAGEILFKPESVPGNSSARGETRQAPSSCASGSLDGTGGGIAAFSARQSASSGGIGYSEQATPTLRASGSGTHACILKFDRTRTGEERGTVLCAATGQAGAEILSDRSPTLSCNHEVPFITCPSVSGTLCGSGAGLSRPAGMASEPDFCVVTTAADCRNLRETPEKSGVLQSKPDRAVRRLTPVECERLQGFPDGWTDIGPYTDETGKTRQSSDTARYSALGNSVAVPVVRHIMGRIARQMKNKQR